MYMCLLPQVPVTKGHGHSSAEDLVACVLHMFSVQTFDLRHLLEFLDGFVAFTSDAGVEVKLTEYQIDKARLGSFAAPWLSDRVNRALLRKMTRDEDDSVDPGKDFAGCEGDQFFRNRFAIPGTGQSIHNIVKGVSN